MQWEVVVEWLTKNWATLANAMAALITAIFTGLLVHYNRGLLQATRTSADAARLSAEAAKTMADIAQQTHRSNQETVVQCFGAEFIPRVRASAPLGANHTTKLVFKNMGPGFAKRFEARAHIGVATHRTPEVRMAAPQLLAPGEFCTLNLGKLSAAQLAGIREKVRATIVGSISYDSLSEPVSRTFIVTYDPDIQQFAKMEVLPPANEIAPSQG